MNLSRIVACCLFVLLPVLCLQPAFAVVKVSGRILHPASDSIRISYNDNKLAYYPKEFYARLDKKGNFSMKFDVPPDVYTQAEIKHGIHLADLMLQDGDSLVLSVDAAMFDSTIQYAGRGSIIANFVARHTINRGRMNQYSVRLKNLLEKNPADYVLAAEKEKADEYRFLEKNNNKLPVSFVTYWTAYYTFYNYFFLQQYPQMHQMMVVRRYTDTVPEENYAVLQAMADSFSDRLMQVPPYLLYLTGVFEARLKAAGFAYPLSVPANAARFLDSVNTLAYEWLPNKSSEYFVAQSLYARIRRQPIERTHAELTAFRKRWPGSEYLILLDKQTAITERLSPGQPAPDLRITAPDGTHLSLSDLRGKVVYIGFWATWCKPCVGEMRLAERKVKEVLKNKPVVFVYVSLDDDSTAAAALMKTLKIESHFVWTTGGWYSPEVSAYGVQGLPTYFLVDTNGNFAVQNPPTPQQSTELIVAISKLY